MIVPGLPSFRDIVLAVELLKKSYKALKDSGESVAKYDESIAFLRSFETCTQHISEYANNSPGDHFNADIKGQLQILEQPCKRLSKFLNPYKAALHPSSLRTSITQVAKNIKFAIKDSQGEVIALKAATALPLHTIMTMLILQTLETAKLADSTHQWEQIASAISMTPTLLHLRVSIQAIEAKQRNRQAVEAEQRHVTAEIKQAIADVDGRLTKELQIRPTRDYAQDQATLQRSGDLHNATNRLESSIRNSPLEEILTQQYEMIQVTQFALEIKVREIREVLNTINAERLPIQSYFRSTVRLLETSIPHIANGVGISVEVEPYTQGVGSTSEIVMPSLAKTSEKQEFDYRATPSQTNKPKHQGKLRGEQADIEQRRSRNISQFETKEEDEGRRGREGAGRAAAGRGIQLDMAKQQPTSESSRFIEIPRDGWICCQCGAVNVLANSPTMCPCCIHSGCSTCTSGWDFEGKQREPMRSRHRCGRGPLPYLRNFILSQL